MALFPTCSFDITVPGAVVHAGQRLEATLEIDVPEPIDRARAIAIVFTTRATAMVGSGNTRHEVEANIFEGCVHIPLPTEAPLAARRHRYPFELDIPESLPPWVEGPDCAIEHKIEARIDVDWAIDPKVEFKPRVAATPRRGERRPVSVHSPIAFSNDVVLEVTLQSAVVEQGERIRGHVALRHGQDARFDAVEIAIVERFDIDIEFHEDSRFKRHEPICVAAEALRSGESAPFVLSTEGVPPAFQHAHMSHAVLLAVSLDVPWARDPGFMIPLDVLPIGSSISGQLGALAVGRERLRRLAAHMADRSGLKPGTLPVLVEGTAGGVSCRVVDAPRGGAMGVDVEIDFPDLQLGIRFGPKRLLAFGDVTRSLPAGCGDDHALEHAFHRGGASLDDGALAKFFDAVFEGLFDDGELDDVRFGDRHFAVYWTTGETESERCATAASFARRKVDEIAASIATLPFPRDAVASAAAWRAAARELGAMLVPTGPALHHLVIGKRLQTGQVQELTASIVTRWTADGPITEVLLELAQWELPRAAHTLLEHDDASPHLRVVRASFSRVRVTAEGRRITLERAELTQDPRELMAAIDALVTWVIEARGERVANSAYR